MEKVNVKAIPDEYIIPEGKAIFTENASGVDIRQYAEADIAIPPPNLQQRRATPTESEQLIEADSGYDGLSAVTVERIPPQYIVPSGSLDITANADGINVTDKASVNVRVPTERTPVLIDTIDIANFSEPVNRVNFDTTLYDLSDYHTVYVIVENVVPSASDWMYIGSTGGQKYTFSKATLFNMRKYFFVNSGDGWYDISGTGTAINNTGDQKRLSTISFFWYSGSTTFVSGRFLIYVV